MELRKTSSVDALNRTGPRSVPFGTRLFGGGGRTLSSPRTDSTSNEMIGVDSSAAAPPKAKVPSWYRNLHHSLLSMDGDSDDDDNDNDIGDQPFEKTLDRSRRTASVDVDIDLESTEQRQMTEPPRLRQRSESVDVTNLSRILRDRNGDFQSSTHFRAIDFHRKLPTPDGKGKVQDRASESVIGSHGTGKVARTTEADQFAVKHIPQVPVNSNAAGKSTGVTDDRATPPLPSVPPPPFLVSSGSPHDSRQLPISRRRQREQEQEESNTDDNDDFRNQHFTAPQQDECDGDEQYSARRQSNDDKNKNIQPLPACTKQLDSAMQVTANGDVGFSLPPVSSSENNVNRRFWPQEDTVNGRRQLPVCPTDIAETASDTGDRAKIDDIDRWQPVCTAAGRTVTASDDDVKARSSLTDVNSSGIPSSVRNSDVFTSNSKERRGWTTELLTRTMASDKDEAARRTQQQRRMPATGAIIKTDDVVPAAAAVAAVDDSHRTSSFSTTNPIIVQSKKQFKWTVAETKSLSRPLSAGQAGSVRSTPTNNRVLYGTRRSCVGNTLSSPSSSDAVVKQNAFPNASVGCVSSSSTRRLPQQPAVGVLTDATPELRRGLSPSTKTETRRFEDESDRSITTPNIHSVLARFKSIESLSTAHGQTSTVATPRVTASKPTVRLQATNGLDAMSKFWSMDNVAGPSAVLSVSRSADVSYQQPKHQQHQQEAVDQGHCETFDVENRHVAQPMVTNGQAHGSISTSIIPPFARIQLQRFRSLEELSQRPPTPTKPSASESGKRNAASPQLELNDSTSKSDVERIRDRYATGSATQTAVNGDASHLATSGALTTTATPSGSKRQYGASVSPSVCEARRYSASASPQNRAAAARQWSPIVRMASSDWSPFSSVAPSDIDNVIGNDGAASPRFSTLPPALQRRPFNASLPNSINTIPSNVSGLSEELSTSRATVRRLPNVPSTASVAANGTGTMHNRAVVDIYNDTDAPRKILTDFGLESSRETRHRQGDAVMTTDDAAGADVISTHVTVPVGMSQSEKTNSRSNGAMTSLVSEEPSVQPPKTSLPPTKSQLVLETSTSGLNTFDAKNDFDRSVVLSSPPPTAVKVMSSLFITLQPSNEGSGMKFNAQSGATSRIRVITSRRMN